MPRVLSISLIVGELMEYFGPSFRSTCTCHWCGRGRLTLQLDRHVVEQVHVDVVEQIHVNVVVELVNHLHG